MPPAIVHLHVPAAAYLPAHTPNPSPNLTGAPAIAPVALPNEDTDSGLLVGIVAAFLVLAAIATGSGF